MQRNSSYGKWLMASLWYLLASGLLGLIAVWASENMFWIVPPADLTVFGLLFIWLAYSFCTASALSAVMLTGVRGMAAVFLGAAIMGWLVEGVIVGEMYQAFPFQLVWTPLAWHALISGGVVFALGRISVQWPLIRQIALWGMLGLFIAFWAQFWLQEQGGPPKPAGLLWYLAGMGVIVPLAHIGLDRLGPLVPPPLWVMLSAPAVLMAIWSAQTLVAPVVIRLSLPVLLVLTLWMMARLGGRTGPVGLGPGTARAWRYFLFLLAPLTGAILAQVWWDQGGDFAANVVVAMMTVPLSLLIYGILLLRAIWPKRA